MQLKGKSRTYQEINFDDMTEQFQTDYPHRYEIVQTEIHKVSQFDESSGVRATYLGKVEMSGVET